MKHKLTVLVHVGLILCFGTALVFAQDAKPKSQLFIIHEDIVKPSMVGQYEKASKNFIEKMKEHNITSMSYGAASSEDLRYLYVTPIANMAELDNNPEKEMAEKMGEDAMKAMFAQFANCYDSHKNFLVRKLNDLSYQPETNGTEAGEMNFIHWNFYHVQPGKEDEARAIAKEWNTLYASKNVQTGYNLYVGGIGVDMPLFVTTQRAKNGVDYQNQEAKITELLGEEGKALTEKTMAITRKFESRNGWARPDLSYYPNSEVSAK